MQIPWILISVIQKTKKFQHIPKKKKNQKNQYL